MLDKAPKATQGTDSVVRARRNIEGFARSQIRQDRVLALRHYSLRTKATAALSYKEDSDSEVGVEEEDDRGSSGDSDPDSEAEGSDQDT